MRQTTVARLFDDNLERLRLRHICGSLATRISVSEDRIWPADMVGHLNLIHPDRLQILGTSEIAWARRQTREKVIHHVREILSFAPPALIVADDEDIPSIIRTLCANEDVALFASPLPAANIIDHLRSYLSRKLAERVALHGVLMDVLGIGVFITGDSGAGKSELALELISRGHGLVADDIVEFSRIAPNVLEGRCPELLQDVIEVRGLGILNIRTIFGETACRRKMKLKLVVHLQRRQPGQEDPLRLSHDAEEQLILGIPVRRAILPVAAGRNLAVLLEAAVRSTILLLRGIDSTQEFIDRQRRAMEENGI
ncbi:HPr(Ser) kinase/phosphatase [Zoogloea sp.]|jgi:HPr kinase/phosphorylase|uniref:HPr(Ser) kinase/phosphatase n=1 Tax=Zoogloea sp. TaxID=49181 RepID=UPI0011D655D4|nr:HPr(Ser) kinase/phosphatase [Zoogloea sp.]MBK6655282.1 HPr kinase/phosphorylase [Zoogloea sp.]MBP7446685.1 HPr kinase/phosphorylase [Zoogloea sp.]TXG95208.1 MAG: HPr kinase/phosphorylase [Zoogloea sp.]HOY00395.1 HPr(Ser) kinase/phosphatase [Zoogloea sp.]HPI59195.1 HPr(Ser) kinase/phosphatase [Zoogloea sp.]